MNQQIVEFVQTSIATTPHEHMERFMLRRDRRAVWLQRIAIWVLRQLRCWAITDEVTITRHGVDTRKLVDLIYKQNEELLNFYHSRGERLLIGAKDFSRLMGDTELNQMVSFTAQYNYGCSIMGLRVTVIPWMSGVLVVPKGL